MTPQEIAQLPIAALLILIGGGFLTMLLTGRFVLGRELTREIEARVKAEKGEADLKVVVTSLTETVSTQAEQLGRLTSISEKLTAALVPGRATS